jgi:hypothetical protein
MKKDILLIISIICSMFILQLFYIHKLEAKRINRESYYQNKHCAKWNGKTEVIQFDKTRVDCLTDNKAIEFDFANKWGECIGQALYYGLVQEKQPSCALIIENKAKDQKYKLRLEKVAKKYNIDIIYIYN